MAAARLPLAALGASLALTPLAHALQAPPPPERIWSFTDLPLDTRSRLADAGGQVYCVGASGVLHLLSSFDGDPANPHWSAATTFGSSIGFEASSERDLAFYMEGLAIGPNQFQSRLRAFRSSSSTPRWERSFPSQVGFSPRCAVTPDGSRVVVVYDTNGPFGQFIEVLDAHSGATLQSHSGFLGGAPIRLSVSADGSTLALALLSASLTTAVFDLASGNLLYTDTGTSGTRNALSADGKTLVLYDLPPASPWGVRALKWNGSTYVGVVDFKLPQAADGIQIGVSEDGSVLAAAWIISDPSSLRISVRAWDLSTGQATMLHSLTAPGLTSANNVLLRDFDISADGAHFALAVQCLVVGALPELTVYSPTSNQPLFEFGEGGSIAALDLSADGRRLVATRAHEPGTGTLGLADLELYRLDLEDFALRGVPALGASVDFELSGPVGATAFVLSSPGPGLAPLALPGVGLLHLDRTMLTVVPLGPIGASGVAHYPLTLSSDPLQVGQTTSYQGWMRAPNALTADWVQLTLLP